MGNDGAVWLMLWLVGLGAWGATDHISYGLVCAGLALLAVILAEVAHPPTQQQEEDE